MDRTPRDFIDEIGGYREVAARLGVSAKTMHAHASATKLPPRWYAALRDLALEKRAPPPDTGLFDFKPLLFTRIDGAAA